MTAATRTAPVLAPQKQLRLAPGIALALIAAGALAVIALWWRDTPTVVGFGGWLTNAGRIAGLLTSYGAVVLVALMARVPAVERGVGTDRLVRWHAMGGRYIVSLAVAHTLLIIWGYAVSSHHDVVSQTKTLVLDYPDVLLATIGLGLFLLVGVTSARAARKRLSYETWQLIHLLTYVAIGLAFAHQFANGNDFAFEPLARVLWSTLFITVGTLLVWFRLLVPLYNFARRGLRVAAVVSENDNVVSIYLSGRNLSGLRAEPGQFFRWRFMTSGLWWAANPYSLSAAPRTNMLRITVQIVGDHSRRLCDLKVGTRVMAEGPYGGFTPALRKRTKVLLIAGGVGIAPIRALLDTMPGRPGDITLLYRASSADDLVLHGEIDQIASAYGTRVYYLPGSRTSDNARWLSAEGMLALVPDLLQHDVFLCGPDGLIDTITAALRRAGVPTRHIHHESFTF